MLKIKSWYLRTFLKGFSLGVLIVASLVAYIVIKSTYEIEEALKQPHSAPSNGFISKIEDKAFYRLDKETKYTFDRDTIYLLYYPFYASKRQRAETDQVIALAKHYQDKPFHLFFISTPKNDLFTKGMDKQYGLTKEDWLFTEDLQFDGLRLVIYKGKIRNQMTVSQQWSNPKVKEFFDSLYKAHQND